MLILVSISVIWFFICFDVFYIWVLSSTFWIRDYLFDLEIINNFFSVKYGL